MIRICICTPARSPWAQVVRASQSPYLQTAHRKRYSGSSVTDEQRHVRAVARPEDPEPLAVDPVDRAQEIRRREAVLRVVDPPDAVVRTLEVAAVPGGAAVVDREPGISLVDEVLGVTVPLAAVAVGRTAVRVDDRRRGTLGRGRRRAGRGTPGSRGRRTSCTSAPRPRRAAPGRRRAARVRGSRPALRPRRRAGARAASSGSRSSREPLPSAVQHGDPQTPPAASSVTDPSAASTVTRSKRPAFPRVATSRVPSGCQRASRKSASPCVS